MFGVVVGLIAAALAYRWANAPIQSAAREQEEAAVLAARQQLVDIVAAGALEIVDPLAPDRVVGKAYVYPADDGWEVSGFYRRDATDLWHPYFIRLDETFARTYLKVSDQDPRLIDAASRDPGLDVLP